MPEAPPDRLGERLGAVDDVEPGALGIETALDQVVEQGPHRGPVLPRALGQARHVFLAARIDAARRRHHVIADMKPVRPHYQKIQFVQQARQPGLQLRPRQRHEAARDRRLGTPVPRRRRQATARVRRQTHRASRGRTTARSSANSAPRRPARAPADVRASPWPPGRSVRSSSCPSDGPAPRARGHGAGRTQPPRPPPASLRSLRSRPAGKSDPRSREDPDRHPIAAAPASAMDVQQFSFWLFLMTSSYARAVVSDSR